MSPDRGGRGIASSRPSVGRGPVASRNQHHVLLREVGVCTGRRGSVERCAPHIGDGAAYLYTVVAAVTLGRCRAHLQGAGAFGPVGDMEWGAICALLHLGCGHALLRWLPRRGVACAGRKVCVGRFCTTSGLWLRQRESGGCGTSPLASVLCDRIGWGLSGWRCCWPIALLAVALCIHRCRALTRGGSRPCWCTHHMLGYDCHPVVGLQHLHSWKSPDQQGENLGGQPIRMIANLRIY